MSVNDVSFGLLSAAEVRAFQEQASLEADGSLRIPGRLVDSGGAGVDLRSIAGALLDGSDESALLDDAVTKAKAVGVKRVTLAGGTLGLPAGYQVDGDIELVVRNGGTIRPLGADVRISGRFEPGPYQVFDLSAGGTIAFGRNVARAKLAWFGGTPDTVTDHGALLQSVCEMCAGGPAVELQGGDPWDSSHGYLIDTQARISQSGVEIVSDQGFVRLIQGPNVGHVILFGGTGSASKAGQYSIGRLWIERTRAGGGGIRFQYAYRIRIQELGGNGDSGSLCDLVNETSDVRIGSIDGYDLGSDGACLFTLGGVEDMQIGRLAATGGQEVADITDAHNWQIGEVWGDGQLNTLEISSCTNGQIGSVQSHNALNNALNIKTEIEGRPVQRIQIGRLVAREWGINASQLFPGHALTVSNSAILADPTQGYIDGVSVGQIDAYSTQPYAGGISVTTREEAGRPSTKNLRVGHAVIRSGGLSLVFNGTEGVDLGVMHLRTDAPWAQGIQIIRSPGVKGIIHATNYTTTMVKLDRVNGCDLTLVEEVAQDRVAVALEGRPLAGVSVQGTTYGRLTVDLPDIRGYGVDLGTSAGGDPGVEKAMVVRARILCEGIGLAANSYYRLRVGGIDEEMATLISTGDQALNLTDCQHRHVRARVRSDVLPSSLYGAATLARGEDHDDHIHVLSSAGKGLVARLDGSGQIELTGGDVLTVAGDIYFQSTFPDGAAFKMVGRVKNANKVGGSNYAYQVTEQCGFAIEGLHLDLQCSDDQAASTTRALNVVSDSALATVITKSFVRLLMTRMFSVTIAGEALIDQPNCIYEKIVSLA